MDKQCNLILEYECSPFLCEPRYVIIDKSTGSREEFKFLTKAFMAATNLARDLGVQVECPSYVLMALWLDGVLSYDDIVPILDGAPLEKKIVESWDGRLKFMNGPIGPREERDA